MPKNSTTVKELYQQYNYPCWDLSLLEKNIVPLPYIPKSKVKCGHKYSLGYNEWKKIVLSLFKHIMLYLMEGNELKLPHSLGYIQIKKRRGYSIDKIHLGKTGEIRKIRHIETDGYKPILKWRRFGKDAYFKNKHIWNINFLKTTWRQTIKELKKDFSIINKFINV